MNKYYLILLVLCCTLTAFAQQPLHKCGTEEGRSEWLREYQKNPAAHARSNGEPIWVPVQIHIVGTDNGGGYYSDSNVKRAFCELREDFEPTDIELYLAGPFNYVNSSQLYEHETFEEGYEIMDDIDTQFPDVVNVYIAEGAAGNCGYASFWNNRVVLAINCIAPESATWAHEMGHVFSLPHTFDGNSYSPDDDLTKIAPAYFERADSSNCAESGDYFCDTPADYLGFRWFCQDDSTSVFDLIDPDSVVFRAHGNYYMSYANDECMDAFSPEQMGAMHAFVLEERPEFLKEGLTFDTVSVTEMVNITPPDTGEMVLGGDQRLSWSPLDNVSFYEIQVSRFPTFSYSDFRGTTQDTFINIDLNANLLEDKTYYWRVKVYNAAYICESYFLPNNSFNTVPAWPLSIDDNDFAEAVNIIPNPVSADKTALLTYTIDQSQEIQINLVGLTGQQLSTQSLRANAGKNEQTIDLNGLPAGVYYVVIRGEKGKAVQKVVVF